jgi:hypothetical protein
MRDPPFCAGRATPFDSAVWRRLCRIFKIGDQPVSANMAGYYNVVQLAGQIGSCAPNSHCYSQRSSSAPNDGCAVHDQAGDTEWTDTLIEAARGADLLVSECYGTTVRFARIWRSPHCVNICRRSVPSASSSGANIHDDLQNRTARSVRGRAALKHSIVF